MITSSISFDQLPSAVADLNRKIDYLTSLLHSQLDSKTSTTDRWLSVEELSEYLPGRPSNTTIYGYVQRRQIPFKRVANKRLAFLKSEIDTWLQSQHRKTQSELSATAELYLSSTRKRK